MQRHVRILGELARIAAESAQLADFLDQAVVQVARAVEIDHVKLLRYRRESDDLLVVAGMGWKPGVVGAATLSTDLRSAPGRSFQTAEPVIIRDFAGQDEYDLSSFLREHGIVSLANTPVLIEGAAWGVLEADSTTPRDFGQDTTEFLVAAAALIGSCIRRFAEATSAAATEPAVGAPDVQDVLLREMQHRVKNNFQFILASITLLKRRHGTGAHAALDEVAARINAISLAHDQLAPREGAQVVRLAEYLRTLCRSIRRQADWVEIDVKADEIELPVDRAVPLGLILNEAATNSIKHAFTAGQGRISVRLDSGVGYGEARLRVSDNGRGMTDPGSSGSGLALINALARQIGGELERTSSTEGTTISLKFPVFRT